MQSADNATTADVNKISPTKTKSSLRVSFDRGHSSFTWQYCEDLPLLLSNTISLSSVLFRSFYDDMAQFPKDSQIPLVENAREPMQDKAELWADRRLLPVTLSMQSMANIQVRRQ
jgi:hypothetical protein